MANNDVEAIIDSILIRSGQDTTTPEFVSRVSVLDMVNELIEELAQENVFINPTPQTVTLVNGTRTYAMSNDATAPYALFDSDGEEIYPTDAETLSELDRDWKDLSGKTYNYIYELEQPKSISLYKKPGSDEAALAYTLWYYWVPAAVTDSSSVYLPEPLRNNTSIIRNGVLSQIFAMRTEVQDRDRSNYHTAQYEVKKREFVKDRIGQKRYVMGSKSGRRPSWRLRLPADYPDVRY